MHVGVTKPLDKKRFCHSVMVCWFIAGILSNDNSLGPIYTPNQRNTLKNEMSCLQFVPKAKTICSKDRKINQYPNLFSMKTLLFKVQSNLNYPDF